MRGKGFVLLLLLLALLGFCWASSSYKAFFYLDGRNYVEWRDFFWRMDNPTGFCAHMATYETYEQLFDIAIAMSKVVGEESYFFYLGAQKQPNSNTFVWAVGPRRGEPFFSVNINPEKVTDKSRIFDLTFENGFTCHQDYCFEQSRFTGYKMVYDALNEAVLFGTYGSIYEYEVTPELDSLVYYGVAEFDSDTFFPNAEGGSKFSTTRATLSYYDATVNATKEGKYLARLESKEQFNWIKDELQCPSVDDASFWLGYERDDVTGNVVKGAGPSQGQVLYSSQTGTCVADLYCNFQVHFMPEKRGVPDSYSLTPRLYTSKYALSVDISSSSIIEDDVSSNKYFLVQVEYCSSNADKFFRFDFAEDRMNQRRMCYPNPTTDWSSNEHYYDGFGKFVSGNSFFAASAQIFENDYFSDTVEKILYFDCNCKTDSKINLACLGSDAFPGGCDLYTDTDLYYYFGLYVDRLKQGLNYTYQRLQQYYYWRDIYFFVMDLLHPSP